MGGFLSFIIIFLEPFDTNEYEHSYKLLLLSGYGGLIFLVFVTLSFIENIWYYRTNKVWRLSFEVVSTIIFFTVSGTVLFLYNHLIVNNLKYSLQDHWWYYKNIVIFFIPILLPPLVYLKRKFGERILPPAENKIMITGKNNNEILEVDKNQLLYINAVENYIEIFFLEKDRNVASKTFRQTLSKAHYQAPYLEKCHRSYLVNTQNIKEIQGNSQRARISFYNTKNEIPLSKSFYKVIKSNLTETKV